MNKIVIASEAWQSHNLWVMKKGTVPFFSKGERHD